MTSGRAATSAIRRAGSLAGAALLFAFAAGAFIWSERKHGPAPTAPPTERTRGDTPHAPLNAWQAGWLERVALVAGPERDAALAVWLAARARWDPTGAWELAHTAPPPLRQQLLQAVLRTWAETDAAAAAACALNQTQLDRRLAVASILQGAAGNPAEAVQLARRLSADHGALSRSIARSLVFALTEAGNFQAAVGFATSSSVEHRHDSVAHAFHRWAAQQPETAASAALDLAEPTLRQRALRAALAGWARRDPAGLADAATRFPIGPERHAALDTALQAWVTQDARAVAGWLAGRPSNCEFDSGYKRLAEHIAATGDPVTAVRWAEAIADPARRSDLLREIIAGWTALHPAAAQQYARQSPGLMPPDRRELLKLGRHR